LTISRFIYISGKLNRLAKPEDFNMARVTVEDCLEKVENRFGLVYVTSKRVKELMRGAKSLYPCDNKEVVTALREIAANKIGVAVKDDTKGKKK